jgi:ATP-dependent Clp protease adaptor protein ClpS
MCGYSFICSYLSIMTEFQVYLWSIFITGDRYSFCKGPCSNLCVPLAVLIKGSGKGGGILEKPVIEKATPGRESEFDLK